MISNEFIHAEMIAEQFIEEVQAIQSALQDGHYDLCKNKLTKLASEMEIALAFSEYKGNGLFSVN